MRRHDDCRAFAEPYGLTEKHCPDPRLTPGGVAAVVVCTLLCFGGCVFGGLYWRKQRAHKYKRATTGSTAVSVEA